MASESKKRLALAIIDFLTTSLKDGTLSGEDQESIEIATSCIADSFKVDPTDRTAMRDALGGQNLLSIYGVYEKLKVGNNSSSSSNNKGGASTTTTTTAADAGSKTNPQAKQANNAEAEALKSQGNSAMARKDYEAAIEAYSQALHLSPGNPVYLSNRAAAYSASRQHEEAKADAEAATTVDPSYTKAWSRLGLARYALGDARGSLEAYQRGIDAEGNGGSEAMRKGYETARKKVEQLGGAGGGVHDNDDDDVGGQQTRGAGGAAAAGGGGMPDLAGLASMLGGGGRGGAGGGGGGMPDLAGLASMLGGGGGRGGAGAGAGGAGGGMPDLAGMMNNPMFANMAQRMMSNPQMMSNLMNNPQLRQMAENFGGRGGGGGAGGGAGGGGGMPDLSSLMSDPNIAEILVPGPKSKLKSSAQRGIRTQITTLYPGLAPYLDEVLPKKCQLDAIKLPAERVTLYVLETAPLFWQHMDDPLMPTLKLVHRFPGAWRTVRIDRGAIRFVLSGATLMVPGLTSQGGRLPSEDGKEAEIGRGETVVVMAEGKEEACLVGTLSVGTQEMKSVRKGVAVEGGHFLGDGLWRVRLD
ncbi:MAG: hypothetical protein M1816_002803 [Peltula sp. TS41687]|nr:MAG: hypothetical protein M1816_002803 [Peltula sp. TS41687]